MIRRSLPLRFPSTLRSPDPKELSSADSDVHDGDRCYRVGVHAFTACWRRSRRLKSPGPSSELLSSPVQRVARFQPQKAKHRPIICDQAATTLAEMSLKMRNRDAEASAITSGEGQVAKRENS